MVLVGETFLAAITIHQLELGTLLLERKDKRQGAILRAWVDTRKHSGIRVLARNGATGVGAAAGSAQAARRVAGSERRAFQGSSASRASTVSAAGRFSNSKFRYAPGSIPLARAVATRE